MAKEEVLVIIPARGGSKGVPRKNLRIVGGNPLLTHTIEHALAARCVDRTVVSTEDPEIARIAKGGGAEVVPRPQELASGTASSESALLHALDYLEEKQSYVPDIVVFLQATSPLRRPYDIDRAVETFRGKGADSLFSACRSHNFYWREEDGECKPVNYDFLRRPRRQDMVPEYLENGSIYVTRTKVLRETGNRLGGRIAIYEMGSKESFQIDTEEDFLLVEQLFSLRHSEQASERLREIRLLVLDFDGVFTDNRVLVMEDGREGVLCHRGDGLGLEEVGKLGIHVVVLSREANPVVAARAAKLGLPYVQGEKDKLSALKKILHQYKVNAGEAAYVGNDTNDLPCMRHIGTAIAVKDAHPEVKAVAHLTTNAHGGHGAIREVADWLLSARRDSHD